MHGTCAEPNESKNVSTHQISVRDVFCNEFLLVGIHVGCHESSLCLFYSAVMLVALALLDGFQAIVGQADIQQAYDCCWFQGESDPYAAAKEMGIFKILESPLNMTTSTIIQRILTNHEAYKVNTHFCTIYSTRCFQLNDNYLEMLSRCLANLISMSTDVSYHRCT